MAGILVLVAALAAVSLAVQALPLPGTEPLSADGDLAAQMVAGIDRYLMREIEASVGRRAAKWHCDFSSPEAYAKSIEPNRERFRSMIGLADRREPPEMTVVAPIPWEGPPDHRIGEGPGYRIYAVRWRVLQGVDGEGLLLEPDEPSVADVIALPDCDWTPEQLVGLTRGVAKESQFARRLAESGCRVLVPMLIDREDTHSGIPGAGMTNQPHREFLWRAAYEMGRTMAGYEVQKVLAAVDWFEDTRRGAKTQRPRIGVIGYGEGGLIAFYAAAADTRIDACCVSGYFGPRESLWKEPIYRSVFGLLTEFGDAEIASLILPRGFIVQTGAHMEVPGPPAPSPGRAGAAPGAVRAPSDGEEESEGRRLAAGVRRLGMTDHMAGRIGFVGDGLQHGSVGWLIGILAPGHTFTADAAPPKATGALPASDARMKRQFEQILRHTQRLMRDSPSARAAFWSKADASSPEKWRESTKWYRDTFWDEVIGRLPGPTVPLNPRSRQIYDTPKFRGYEVMLDVYPDVFAYGILLVPRNIKPGERRPVVVCQHGLEGRPQDLADPAVDDPSYHRYACRLAEEGFVTFAPQNPYIGGDNFRVLLRKAQPLKLTLFSFIARQHERILEWLAAQPFVDPQRIGFYGLSYGGKTAMRVPALLERYCLSICSADYNEWVWKCATADGPNARYSYLLTNEYDMPEWNLANTFNYAEMSWLICPRPFMVERGHDDGVAPDEWVAYEYAKTRRRYDGLGLGDRTEIEFFNGPHTIHGVGTFAFLRRHLNPAAGAPSAGGPDHTKAGTMRRPTR